MMHNHDFPALAALAKASNKPEGRDEEFNESLIEIDRSISLLLAVRKMLDDLGESYGATDWLKRGLAHAENVIRTSEEQLERALKRLDEIDLTY